jgi:hypothetical protein
MQRKSPIEAPGDFRHVIARVDNGSTSGHDLRWLKALGSK